MDISTARHPNAKPKRAGMLVAWVRPSQRLRRLLRRRPRRIRAGHGRFGAERPRIEDRVDAIGHPQEGFALLVKEPFAFDGERPIRRLHAQRSW